MCKKQTTRLTLKCNLRSQQSQRGVIAFSQLLGLLITALCVLCFHILLP